MSAVNPLMHAAAIRMPEAPPKMASTVLSVRNWRTRIPREAPNANCMEISLTRDVALAIIKLAKLAQAIIKTRKISMQLALGASRGILERQFLTESTVLAIL